MFMFDRQAFKQFKCSSCFHCYHDSLTSFTAKLYSSQVIAAMLENMHAMFLAQNYLKWGNKAVKQVSAVKGTGPAFSR